MISTNELMPAAGRWTFDFECEWMHFQSFTLAGLTFVHLPHMGAVGYSVALLGFVFTGTYTYDTKPMERFKAIMQAAIARHSTETVVEKDGTFMKESTAIGAYKSDEQK